MPTTHLHYIEQYDVLAPFVHPRKNFIRYFHKVKKFPCEKIKADTSATYKKFSQKNTDICFFDKLYLCSPG